MFGAAVSIVWVGQINNSASCRFLHKQQLKTPVLQRLVHILMAFLFVLPLMAQDEEEYRLELGGGVGAAFSLNDANSKFFGKTNLGAGLVARFPLNPRMAVKTAFSYARTVGDVSGVANFYPSVDAPTTERLAYEYNGGICDLSALYELHFLPYGYAAGYLGHHRLVPYLQVGVGLTYGTPSKAFTVNLPMGVGLKYKVGRRLNLGLEWRIHLTPSDKLEGLEAPLFIKSGGFRNKDHYSFTMLTLTYDLAPKCPTCNRD